MYFLNEFIFFFFFTVTSVPIKCLSLLSSLLGFVSLSCFQNLYLGNHRLYLDETWCKCWNLGPIDCIKISKHVIGQRGKHFFAFLCVSEHFESIEIHFFFSKIFVSAKRKTRASEASQMRACWSDWLYQTSKLHKKVILIYHIVL